MKKILVISGSPKRDGNTSLLVGWLSEGARSLGAEVEVVRAAELRPKSAGCISCRNCQDLEEYGCVIKDGVRDVLMKMTTADAIVFASPLYFFSASAQTKSVFDRMFSLYKWDNSANTMRTALKGKTLAVMASAYEDVGLDALEKPFKLTADYSGMAYASLLVPNAGVSGEIGKIPGVEAKARDFGRKLAG
jgi:multimeric flavodoxin WrbA